MTLSEELTWRGFVNQTTFEDISAIDGAPISFYWGVDPSADSMTIGNLAAAMMVRHFIDHGHNAFLLIGGATGMIGDPDGKKDERNLKTLDEIQHNKQKISAQYSGLFNEKPFTMVDNYDWFSGINYLTFLRDVGKFVPLSNMLGRDFVQARIGEGGSGISYAEFSYSLIQGYDFLHLFREHGVTLQVAASDQWGNSIAGVDLIRRIEGADAHVYTTPLVVNKATGVKFGKSEEGAIWLDSTKTSVYQFYQFWLNVDDAGTIDYMKIYTLLPKDEIERIASEQAQNPGARVAQKTLAYEVTKLVHGSDRADSVDRITHVLFGGASASELSDDDYEALKNEIPHVALQQTVTQALVSSGVANSLSEARRLISGGAVTIDGEKITEDFLIHDRTLLKKGKNSFVLVS